MSRRILSCLVAGLLLVSSSAGAEPLGRVDEGLNRLFQPDTGWIGGDGGTSVEVAPGRIVWLFSDTFVGLVRDGKRMDATMVNNTAAVQQGTDANSLVEFAIRRDDDGNAESLIVPEDGKGFFWIHAAAMAGNRLLIFLVRIEKVSDDAFGFREVDRWLGVVDNPLDPPTAWHVQQLRIPYELNEKKHLIGFGAAALTVDEDLYIYGIEEQRDRSRGPLRRSLIVARVPTAKATDFEQWRFYSDGEWQPDFRRVTPLVNDVASEDSVIRTPDGHQFLLVYTPGGLSKHVQVRTAPRPWGPWSEPTFVYECPEMDWDRRNFCYGAKAHAGLSTDEEFVLTYFTNSTDFWHVAGDARLYWPKFVRVPWTAVLRESQ